MDSISDTPAQFPATQSQRTTTSPAHARVVVRAPRLTVERLAYATIFVLSVLTRFWDLGSRALHHDESEHAFYSWVYAQGGGYTHDPLLHGPFLFHANALVTLLFGGSDATSRFMPATAGVVVVLLPWFLRGPRLLGRWGALSAGVFLLLSPSILYYSRFIRHDVYTLIGTFLLFIAIARYVETPAPRWLILGAASIGFLTTTKEVSFIVFFIFGIFLLVAAAWRIAPILLVIGAAAGAGFMIVAKALAILGAPPLPSIPWSNPNGAQLRTFAFDLLVHPLVISGIGVGLLAVVASIWILSRRRDPERGWIDTYTGEAPPDSTAVAVGAMLSNRRALLTAIIVGITIYAVLYTSLFTNPIGLATGSFGALGYWLGQQGVQRGQEPWFYYLLLVPQYEFIGAILFPVAFLLLARETVTGWRRNIPFNHRWWLKVFIAFWAVTMFAVLSWAGEKMPWLTVHIALPLILLSAMLTGDAIGWLERTRRDSQSLSRNSLVLFGGSLLIAGSAGFALLAWMTGGPITGAGRTMARQIRPFASDHWWLLLSLPAIAFILVVVYGLIRLGPRASMIGLLLTTVVGLLVLQIHDEWRLTYRQGDVPYDMLIYVQTSPYVPQLTSDLRQLSLSTNGDMSLNIWFDSVTSWPFNWYLRDFTGRQYYGTNLPSNLDAPVVLIGSDNVSTANAEALKNNYTMQEYPMRWWFPEEQTYRRFAYAPDIKQESRQNYQDSRKPPFTVVDVARSVLQTLGSLRHPQEQAKLFRIVGFRELPTSIQSTNFRVYIRSDLMPQFDAIRYRSGG